MNPHPQADLTRAVALTPLPDPELIEKIRSECPRLLTDEIVTVLLALRAVQIKEARGAGAR